MLTDLPASLIVGEHKVYKKSAEIHLMFWKGEKWMSLMYVKLVLLNPPVWDFYLIPNTQAD